MVVWADEIQGSVYLQHKNVVKTTTHDVITYFAFTIVVLLLLWGLWGHRGGGRRRWQWQGHKYWDQISITKMVKTCKIVSSTPLRGTLIKESEPGGNQYISAAGASLVQSAVAMRRYKCRMMIVWPEEQFSRVHDTAAQHRRLPPPWRRLATLPRLLSCVAAAPEPDRAWNEPSRSLKLYNHGEEGSPWLKVATSC